MTVTMTPPRIRYRSAVLAALFLAIAPGVAGAQTKDGTAPATDEQVMGLVHVCSSCHGLDGKSISPTFPRLAGQTAPYLEAQLISFRDHTRADPHARTYMWGMAGHLSDSVIKGVAAYFAGQTPATGTPADPADMAAGQKIFEEGVPARDVPACQACHGEHAEGQDVYPRLASQHRDYLIEQLQNFASNARANEIMHDNSKHLNPDEIRQITAYLGSL